MSQSLPEIEKYLDSIINYNDWILNKSVHSLEYSYKGKDIFYIRLEIDIVSGNVSDIVVGIDFDGFTYKTLSYDWDMKLFLKKALLEKWRRAQYFYQNKHFQSRFYLIENHRFKQVATKTYSGVTLFKQIYFLASPLFEFGFMLASSLVKKRQIIKSPLLN